MVLRKILSKKKKDLLSSWFQDMMDEYPAKTSKVFTKLKNPFDNPVGSRTSGALEKVLDALIEGIDDEKLTPILDEIVRIKALQKFAPSEALNFVFALRRQIIQVVGEDAVKENFEEMQAIEAEIDRIAMISFDIYISCRERLLEIKEKASARAIHSLTRQAESVYKVDPMMNGCAT